MSKRLYRVVKVIFANVQFECWCELDLRWLWAAHIDSFLMDVAFERPAIMPHTHFAVQYGLGSGYKKLPKDFRRGVLDSLMTWLPGHRRIDLTNRDFFLMSG
jgi:hypothetical protein